MTRPPNFDRVARLYRWCEYAALGPLLQRTRTHHLARLADRRQALILGDGDGRFTARLLASNRAIRVHAIDTSLVMLQLLQRRAARATASSFARLSITHADARKIAPDPGTDLVVTHFFLDCLTQPEVDALVARIARLIKPQSLWLFSDFRIPSGPLHWPARVYIRALYLAFRILTGLRVTRLPDHANPLRAASFTLIATHRLLCGILTTELWQRSAESLIVPDNPATPSAISPDMTTPIVLQDPSEELPPHNPTDPQPDPEPASPSLPAPDPGVFKQEPPSR